MKTVLSMFSPSPTLPSSKLICRSQTLMWWRNWNRYGREEQCHRLCVSPQECQWDDARPHTLLCGPDQLLGLPAACRHVHWPTQQRRLHTAAQTQQCRDLQSENLHVLKQQAIEQYYNHSYYSFANSSGRLPFLPCLCRARRRSPAGWRT